MKILYGCLLCLIILAIVVSTTFMNINTPKPLTQYNVPVLNTFEEVYRASVGEIEHLKNYMLDDFLIENNYPNYNPEDTIVPDDSKLEFEIENITDDNILEVVRLYSCGYKDTIKIFISYDWDIELEKFTDIKLYSGGNNYYG